MAYARAVQQRQLPQSPSTNRPAVAARAPAATRAPTFAPTFQSVNLQQAQAPAAGRRPTPAATPATYASPAIPQPAQRAGGSPMKTPAGSGYGQAQRSPAARPQYAQQAAARTVAQPAGSPQLRTYTAAPVSPQQRPGAQTARPTVLGTTMQPAVISSALSPVVSRALSVYGGQVEDKAPAKNEQIVARLAGILTDRAALKHHVIHCFQQACNARDHLERSGLQKFETLCSKQLDVPVAAFDNNKTDFERFDFNGDNMLSINQAYKLVKYSLVEYRKRLGATPTTANIPLRPDTGGYELIKDLGNGAYGFAKLARSPQGEEVCLKMFPKGRMTPGSLDDLTHEFEALKLLQCDVIAGADDFFQDAKNYYLVGEVYRGGDWNTFKPKAIAQKVSLTEDWWRNVFRQVVSGLAFMHEQALVHCDIKEPNLMLKNTDFAVPQVVIIDLGVAVCIAQADNGDPHGTPGYVPPETLETLMWFPRGDLFSFGVVMMQMIIDKVPTDGPRSRSTPGGIFQEGCLTAPEIFQATKTRPAPLHLMPKSMPQLTKLVDRLLQKKRQDRPTAPQALKDPWFGEQEVYESWALSSAAKELHPKNAFATQGITKEMFMAEADEDEEAEDGMDV